MEELEGRRLLFAWSADEVYLLELVNRARANPVAEGVRLGIDLTEGLTSGQSARLVAQEPLALNEHLTVAARLHSQDMADRGFFDHVNPDGLDPTDRALAQGYSYSAGENIAAGYFTMDAVHTAWLQSLHHRLNVLSLYEDFDDSFKYTEFGSGTGIPTLEGDPYGVYQTEMFGYQGLAADVYVLGVVYTDADVNSFYGVGEGKAGVRVDVLDGSMAVVGTYTTDAAGNYQIAAPAGTYTLLFTEISSGDVKSVPLTIATQNVKVDARDSEFAPPADTGGGGGGGGGTGGGDTGGGGTGGGGAGGGGTGGGDTGGGGTGGGDTGGGGTGGGGTGGGGTGGGGTGGGGTGGGDTGGGDSTPPAPDEAKSGAVINASTSANDTLTVSTINELGLPVILRQENGGAWTITNLGTMTGGATLQSSVVTWSDGRDGLSYASVATSAGLLVFKRAAGGTWSVTNLTSSIAGAAAVNGSLTQFTSVDGVVFLAGTTASHELVFYSQSTLGSWTFRNVSVSDLTPQGQATPVFAGELVSFVTSWNALNIAGLDQNGHIRAVWIAAGMTLWREDDLSLLTGAPALSGGLTPFLTSWGAINLAGVDGSGDLLATWWVPGGEWQTSNLTALFGGPKLVGATISSFVTPWGAMNIAGVDAAGKLSVYWWAPGMTDWAIATLSDQVAGAIAPAGPIRGATSDAAAISLLGASSTGAILRYTWRPGDVWKMENLTDAV